MGGRAARRTRALDCVPTIRFWFPHAPELGLERHRNVNAIAFLRLHSGWERRDEHRLWRPLAEGPEDEVESQRCMVPRGLLRGEFLIIHDKVLEPSSVPMEFMKRPGQHLPSGATASGLQPLPFCPQPSTRARRGASRLPPHSLPPAAGVTSVACRLVGRARAGFVSNVGLTILYEQC